MAGAAILVPPVQATDIRLEGAEVIDDDEFRRQVAEAAYFLAEHRGFAPGHDLEDWLEAERQIKDEWILTA